MNHLSFYVQLPCRRLADFQHLCVKGNPINAHVCGNIELPFVLEGTMCTSLPGRFANMIDKFTNYTVKMRKKAAVRVKIQTYAWKV